MPRTPQHGFTRAGDLLPEILPDGLSLSDASVKAEPPPKKNIRISKRVAQRSSRLVAVREDREQGRPQHFGYLARPFILCGLPFKKPKKGVSYYKRQNGNEVLEIIAHPEHGLPFGMDVEVLIWTCILAKQAMLSNNGKCPAVLEFASGADFLKAFDLPLDGASYRRAVERFTRVVYATWYFGPASPTKKKLRLWSFRFFDRVNLWFDPELHTPNLPGEDFKNNQLFLSPQLQAEMERALPVIEMETLRAWANNPTQVHFNIWLAWRCYDAKPGTKIPLSSVKDQCGFEGYDDPEDGAYNFRRKIKTLLNNARLSWPACPVHLVAESHPREDHLLIEQTGSPIRPRQRLS
jgi:hypothetical protein